MIPPSIPFQFRAFVSLLFQFIDINIFENERFIFRSYTVVTEHKIKDYLQGQQTQKLIFMHGARTTSRTAEIQTLIMGGTKLYSLQPTQVL